MLDTNYSSYNIELHLSQQKIFEHCSVCDCVRELTARVSLKEDKKTKKCLSRDSSQVTHRNKRTQRKGAMWMTKNSNIHKIVTK